ncbi:MAG: 3-oxoacyl-[acyl-carrier-protein] synthase 3 [Rhodothermaceae bacterium]|nr:MAG: 3-oxoacyl-[acyl-carrier-protein] synthase 3 [Rhodothermaceae bacterium]
MPPPYAHLVGWGNYVPERVLTNDDLARLVDTSDEWIRTRSGIRERRVVGEGEHTSTMAAAAGRAALARAGLAPTDLDLIIVATSSPDHLTPPVSSQVQDLLGARCGAFQMVVGCTGFVYALVTAGQFIATGACRTVLVVGAELTSRWIDWTDRTTCVLFGDGAGAVVLQATDTPCGLLSFVLGSDGAGAEHLIVPGGGVAIPPSHESIDAGLNHVRMNGREVFKFATRTMVEALEEVLQRAGLTTGDIDLFIPHQANLRIIEYAAQQAGLPMDRVVVNVDRYGNTSAASVPLALCEALDEGRARPGDTLALVAFGAGLTWAAALFQLGPLPTATPSAT